MRYFYNGKVFTPFKHRAKTIFNRLYVGKRPYDYEKGRAIFEKLLDMQNVVFLENDSYILDITNDYAYTLGNYYLDSVLIEKHDIETSNLLMIVNSLNSSEDFTIMVIFIDNAEFNAMQRKKIVEETLADLS